MVGLRLNYNPLFKFLGTYVVMGARKEKRKQGMYK